MRSLVFLLASILFFGAAVKAQQLKPDFVVAKDGSGNFKTIQEAINAVPDFRKNKR
jgi:pectinesterase